MDEESALSQEGFETLEEYSKKDEQLTLFSLQDLAVKTTASIKTLRDEIKTATQMYNDALMGSFSYQTEKEKTTQQQDILKAAKKEIEKQPAVLSLLNKKKELKAQLKEKKEEVSLYALEVLRQSGSNEFEKDGVEFEIKTVSTLVTR